MSTEQPKKEVLMVGFGAVGGMYSYIIKKSGLANISVVARSNYEIVRRDGVSFRSLKYGNFDGWRPDAVYKSITDAISEKEYDYVLVATKAIPELTTTPQLLEPFLTAPFTEKHKQPTYILFQNGLGVEKDLYQAVRKVNEAAAAKIGGEVEEPRIVDGAVWIGTNLIGPNVVEHGDFDNVVLGIYRHNDRTTVVNSPREQAILEEIAAMIKGGGSDVRIVPEIQRMKFNKNFWNVTFSSITTLTHYALPSIFRAPPAEGEPRYAPYVHHASSAAIEKYTIPQIEGILDELMTLGRALGYDEEALPSSTGKDILTRTRAIHVKADSAHKPSMMLDMERGLPFEVEVILGEVVRMAQEVGVSVPRVEMMYGLLLVVQNQILRKRSERS